MSYQRVEGVVSAAGANAIDEQAGLGIARPRGNGMDPRGRWSVAVNFILSISTSFCL
jgi:hypothetical protein